MNKETFIWFIKPVLIDFCQENKNIKIPDNDSNIELMVKNYLESIEW